MNLDKKICCKLKINKNINPLTGIPFTKKENGLKIKYIKNCNNFFGKKPIRDKKKSQEQGVPIDKNINLKNKILNINLIKSKDENSIFVDNKKSVKNIKSKSNIIKSPKLKKNHIKNLNKYSYQELKNKYKNKINKKLTIEIFNKFKKMFKIKKNKYVSILTKSEYIDLIKYLKL